MEENLLNIPDWNKKNLTPPEMVSRAFVCKHASKVSSQLSALLHDIEKEIKEVSESLNTDAALLSRLVFRMKKVFRHDKTLQGLQKIKKCLSNLLSIDLLSTINELEICTYDVYGPTKEMVQWTMLTFQRLCALLHAMITRCSDTVPSLRNKLDSGHHWHLSIVLMGVIARLWLIARHLCLKSCEWYLDMKQYLAKTKVTNENLMLTTHNFPQDLSDWLGNPSYLKEKSNEVLVFSAAVTDAESEAIGEDESIDLAAKESEEDVTSLYFKEDLGKIITKDQLKEFILQRARAEYKDEVLKHGKKAGNLAINRKLIEFAKRKKDPNKWKTAKKCPYTLGNESKKRKK